MVDVDLKALIERLDKPTTRALESAAALSVSQGAYEVGIEHLILKLTEKTNGDVQLILHAFDITPDALQKSLQQALEGGRTGNDGKPVFSRMLIDCLQKAWLVASMDFQYPNIRGGVILFVVIADLRRYLSDKHQAPLDGIPPERLRRQLKDILASGEHAKENGAEPLREEGSALSKYTLDFTGQAREGKIDPVFCRDREIRQMIDILGRRRKNNPIAVGEPGVGKTAVVEGLALKVVEGDVPDVLKNVEIYGLDMGLLQAGASVKGEFENRLKQVIEEVHASPKPIILFIDEAHTLIGAGGQAGGSDAANLLKPALARGELRTIAATTWSEYKKYFEKDPALARRFQLVKLDEPSPEDAITIIRGLRDAYEQAHGVYVRDDGISAAAQLSARYVSGRLLPDKAIDVLDTACARVKINLTAKPKALDERERLIATLQRELNAIQRDINTGVHTDNERVTELNEKILVLENEQAALQARWDEEKACVEHILELRHQLALHHADDPDTDDLDSEAINARADDDEDAEPFDINAVQEELDRLRNDLAELQGDEPLIPYEVGPEEIGAVISDWTGIPLGNMVRDEAATVLSFADDIRTRIKGQDDAITAIHKGVQAAKTGLNNPDAPMGVFLFVGPSGVGKTETALAVADLLFGGERFMTAINMSEFQEKHTVSRLIGSPPGYVGYGEGGVLTEAVRQRPYSVVLLDEVEKADLEVMNLFYQVFDKGMLSDGEGREINFKNTIIFLTSNLASELIMEMVTSSEGPLDAEILTAAVRPILSQHFKPALLARMQIIPYLPINTEALQGITRLKLDKLAARLHTSQKMGFEYSDAVVDTIVQRCTEVETGARNVDHIISSNLLPQISTEILVQMNQEILPDTLLVDISEAGDFTYTFSTADLAG